MPRKRAECIGCGRSIPVSATTTTAKGILCPMCQTQDTDPVEEFRRAVSTAKKFGVPVDAKPGKPLWAYTDLGDT